MAEPTIKRGSDYFFTTTYEGNGGGQRVGNFVPFTDNGTIAKSCIFNAADSPGLTRTLSGDGDKTKFTISFWVKRGKLTGGYEALVIGGGTGGGTASSGVFFNSSNQLYTYFYGAEAITTNRTFEDTSKFYHVVVRVDTSLSTADDRVRMYVDGDQITSFATRNNPSQDANETLFNVSGKNIDIGRHSTSTNYLDGYMAEVNLADGQSYGPETFGITDTSTGRWIPKSLSGITYGTNGFRMQFANSAGQTIGDDTSGQGNDKTVVNVATTDLTTDSPTQNHTTLNSIDIGSNITLSEGNLKATYSGGSQSYGVASRTPVKGGKYYCECTVNTRGSQLMFVNVWNETEFLANHGNDNPVFKNGGIGYRDDTGDIDCTVRGGINIDYGATYTDNDVIGIALDADTGTVWYSKNGTWQNNASSAQIANGLTANSAVTGLISASPTYNENNRFLFGVTAHSGHVSTWNFGQKAFSYTPPTGYNAVQQDNFPETSKDLPDFVWSKSRDNTESHTIYDSSRGATKQISSNNTTAENTQDDGLQKFLKGGYQCEDHSRINQSGISYASWKWHANGGTTSANTSSSVASSTVQVNQTAGFSIVRYEGTGSDSTIEHGLGTTPQWILVKNLSSGNGWRVFHTSLGTGKYLRLDTTSAAGTSSEDFGSTLNSTVFQVLSNGAALNADGDFYIAYCWTGIPGYSKFGKYVGNGNADGPMIHTGFKPAWIMVKQTNSTGGWIICDNTRSPFNPVDKLLSANLNSAESTFTSLDILSNGFKQRNTDTGYNGNGSTYIYMAFAEHPFVGNGTNPVTAR